jgi:hypothetical protein
MTGTDASWGKPAISSPLWVVLWKITVPTLASLPRQTLWPVSVMSGGVWAVCMSRLLPVSFSAK